MFANADVYAPDDAPVVGPDATIMVRTTQDVMRVVEEHPDGIAVRPALNPLFGIAALIGFLWLWNRRKG